MSETKTQIDAVVAELAERRRTDAADLPVTCPVCSRQLSLVADGDAIACVDRGVDRDHYRRFLPARMTPQQVAAIDAIRR